MIVVTTQDATTRLAVLLQAVENEHETVRICRQGTPVADLIPVPAAGSARGRAELRPLAIPSDLCAPLEAADWPDDLR